MTHKTKMRLTKHDQVVRLQKFGAILEKKKLGLYCSLLAGGFMDDTYYSVFYQESSNHTVVFLYYLQSKHGSTSSCIKNLATTACLYCFAIFCTKVYKIGRQ
jgi:hypothetical protein